MSVSNLFADPSGPGIPPASQDSSGSTPRAGARIALLLPYFSRYGGVEQFAWRLAEGLARRGYVVEFLCARKKSEAPEGVTVREVGRIGGLPALKMAWFACRTEIARSKGCYDLVISLGKTWNQDVLRIGGGPLGNYHRLSLMAWPEGPRRWAKTLSRLLSPANLLTRVFEKRQYGGKTRIIAVSHLVREWVVTAYPQLRREDIPVVYNRPDPARFRPPMPEERRAARAALGIADGDFAIGTASTNFRLKGVAPLIRALARLPERARLFVAGGRGSAVYERLAEECGVRERARFLGKVSDMPSFYHALDAFSLPTFYDACANATLEALASGLHVTSSRQNGASYFLPPENVTKSPADPAELAAMLRAFIGQAAPPPFVWPADVPAGVDAFMDLLERELAAQGGRHASGQFHERWRREL